jgi:Cys-rich protein (TIGR04453 family)
MKFKKNIFPYIPFLFILLSVISFTVFKSVQENFISKSISDPKICNNYCNKFADCAASLDKRVLEQKNNLTNVCIRVCNQNYEKISSCTSSTNSQSCVNIKNCLTSSFNQIHSKI